MSVASERFEQEYQQNALTRSDNDASLLPRISLIRSGEAIDALARFAKAYLGLFLDMDNSIAPVDRISILANTELAHAIWQGMHNTLTSTQLPDPRIIADHLYREHPLDQGYVMLAAVHHQSLTNRDSVLSLDASVLATLVCFHYAHKTSVQDHWLDAVLTHKRSVVVPALLTFWLRLIEHELDYLPGVIDIVRDPAHAALAADVLIPILQHWHHCRKKILREILGAALQVCDRVQLAAVCDQALQDWNPNEPARYTQWVGAAYLINPQHHAEFLAAYLGRSRERILPLLDFVVMTLQQDRGHRYDLDAQALADLLRSIAPKFTPQEDRQGNLCDNTQRVLYLFYRLATVQDAQAIPVIKQLAQIRVMKLYKEILEYSVALHQGGETPTLEVFVSTLRSQSRIKAKSNWSDLR